MNESEESSIERLKRTLYSRNENLVPKEKRTPVSQHELSVPKDWGDKPNYDVSEEIVVKRNNSFFNKFLVGSIGFFVVSVCIALFIFFGGINMISSNNLDIEIVAPTSISSGEEMAISLSIVNGNRTDLESVSLFVDYPEGAYSVLEQNKAVTREEIKLGTVKKGGNIEQSIRTILFGEKDTVKSFIFRIEYKVKGSNAVLVKEKTYDVLIGSSPILLEVKYPKEVNSGQNVTLSIEVTSNSPVALKDTLIKIEYPYGFTYKESNIKPVRDNSIWNIGDLKNGDIKKIDITGTILGQNLEDRSFRISAGTKTGEVYDFDTTLVSSLITIGIRKSFFDLSLASYRGGVGLPGEAVSTQINWQNTLPDKVVDSRIEVKLSGNAVDRSKVSASSNGFYRSVDDTVLWDKNTTESLVEMSPGQSGGVTLSVSSIQNLVQPTLIKNPHINLKVSMVGERVGREGGIVSSEKDFVVKISSLLNFANKVLRTGGPFTNSGTVPPKADKETTYTVNWLITNTTNDLKNTIARTTLPAGVTWKGEVSPSTEKIKYDPDTRVITWDIGNVSAGVGFVNSPRQVYFKLGLIPSINQVGTTPSLTSQVNISSTDTYTEKQIELMIGGSTSKFVDASFSQGNDVVVN